MEEAWRMLEVLLVFRFEETWTRPSDDEKKPEGGKYMALPPLSSLFLHSITWDGI